MKKLFFILLTFIIISFTGILHSQQNDNWKWLNPSPQGNTIYDIDFINDDLGFSVGAFGTVIKTVDGGVTWTQMNTNFNTNIHSLDFVDEMTGYIGGNGQMFKRTQDGGLNWTDIQLPSDPDFYVVSIQFVNANTGYVLGFFQLENRIWKTTDAGETWTTMPDPEADYLDKLYFFDENYGFGIGGSLGDEIVKTTNGGVNWQLIDHFSYPKMSAIHFFDQNNGLVAGNDGCVLLTNDAGETWTRTGSPTSLDVTTLLFTDQNTGYGIGFGSECIKTTNGGLNWTVQSLGINSPNGFFEGEITSNGTMHAVGDYGTMIRSTDNGSNWLTQYSVTDQTMTDITFTDNFNGYAVCGYSDGDILKTTDAGETWNSMVTGYQLSMYGIVFTEPNIGYVAGSLTIYKTTNAGLNWSTSYLSTTSEIFTDIEFVNSNTGYAVGSYGRLLKTTNAGDNWTSHTIDNPGSLLLSIDFVDESIGYVTGDWGVIMKTTDAGASWVQQATPLQFNNINSANFIDANTGYTSSSQGVLKTIDGGNNWVLTNTPTGNYYKVQFKENFGYAVSTNGKIIKSTDAGANWIEQATVTNNGLYALYVNSDFFIYSGGLRGTILKTFPSELITNISGNYNTQPDEFNLFQNYPNPFNPVTKISFSIPAAGLVNLDVYDIVGRKVASLVSGQLNAGLHVYEFNGSRHSSGTYFYRLETNGIVETKRMTLIK